MSTILSSIVVSYALNNTTIKSQCHKFSTGSCNSEKTKNLKKNLKVALGELFLKINIFLRSDKYFGRTETNLVSQLSGLVLGV